MARKKGRMAWQDSRTLGIGYFLAPESTAVCTRQTLEGAQSSLDEQQFRCLSDHVFFKE